MTEWHHRASSYTGTLGDRQDEDAYTIACVRGAVRFLRDGDGVGPPVGGGEGLHVGPAVGTPNTRTTRIIHTYA